MFDKLKRVLKSMELEERVIHIGVLIALLGLFFPWAGEEWQGETQQWSGFSYHTGFMGHLVFMSQLFILAVTLSPMFGGPSIVRKSGRNGLRLLMSACSLLVLFCGFTIILRLTSEITGTEIRFGVYLSMLGSALATLYLGLQYKEQQRIESRELFLHPDEQSALVKKPQQSDRIPPPPPPPSPAEDHHLFKNP